MGFGEIVLLMVIGFVMVAILLALSFVGLIAIRVVTVEETAEKVEEVLDSQATKMGQRYKDFMKELTQGQF
jgi:xanthine/uracil/vitamin C permease (AzgA family)